jgi:aminopeptidase N
MKSRPLAPFVLLVLCAAGMRPAAAERMPFAPAGQTPQYAPARQYDLRHLRLDLAFDWSGGAVSGTATNTLSPLRSGLDHLVFHAAGLDVQRVRLAGAELPFTLDPAAQTLTVDLGRAYGPEDRLEVAVDYSARPRAGLYFVGPDAAYPGKPRQIWSQGETENNRHWFPTWDYPNDRATTEMLATVERPFTAVSNGELVEVVERPDGRRTFHWRMEQPHTTYLISIMVGELVRIADDWRGIPVEYYVPPGYEEQARRSFGKTPDMMEYFSTVTGHPYPYAKYAQTTAVDYMWGGMENITATTQTILTLHDERAEIDYPSEGLVAHELAHQWFGDLVTLDHWAHLWLNEGMADYFTALYRHRSGGEDEFVWEMDDLRQDYMREDAGEHRRPIVTLRYSDPITMFDRHSYEKGALVLHMARYLTGEEGWWRGIRGYLDRFALRTVTTPDLQGALEQASGASLGPLFDQYVHGAGHPEIEARWEWQADRGMVRLNLRQVQERTEETGLFSFPVEIALIGPSGTEVHRVPVLAREEQDLYIPSAARPRTLVFDPRGWMLKDLRFDKPAAEWVAQYDMARHLATRLEALRALGELGGEAAVAALGRALREDPFHGARQVAAEALQEVGTEAALAALRPGLEDRDARVRGAVLGAFGEFPEHRDLIPLLRRALEGEDSYKARAAAAESLGKFGGHRDEVAPVLVRALAQESHRQVVRGAAIEALAELEAPQAFEHALRLSRYGSPAESRDEAMNALARIARASGDPKRREQVRRILEGYLSDKSYNARTDAQDALAEMEDPAVIPALERSARNAAEGQERHGALEAIEDVREALGKEDLEQRVEQLEREVEVLREGKGPEKQQ